MTKQRYMLFALVLSGCCFCQCLCAISIEDAVNIYALRSPRAKVLRLNYENSCLDFDNYRKSFLPMLSFSLNPISFNNSLRLLQDPVTGSYSYVKDNANTSYGEMSVIQKIGITGGTLMASSSISFLREFSGNRNSYNTSPLYISYSQPLRGNVKRYRLNRSIMHLQHALARKVLCTSLSEEQQKVVTLYMTAWYGQLRYETALSNVGKGDTLLTMARLKLDNGYITPYDYNQIELQQLDTRMMLESAAQERLVALRSLCTELGVDSICVERPHAASLPLYIEPLSVTTLIRKNNPQALNGELRKRQAELERYEKRMETRFNGNISLSYGLNQYAPTFSGAYRNPERRQTVGITLTIPAFQWGINHNKRRMADNSYNAEMIELEQAEAEFENEIKTLADDYNHARKTLDTAERVYMLSQKQYGLSVEKFGLGRISVYELFNAYSAQMSAMQKYYDSMNTLYTQYFSLRHATLYDFVGDRDLEAVLV